MKKRFKSIRSKLFITLCVIVISIIILLIILNKFVLESFYIYNKKVTLKNVYQIINDYYNNNNYNQNKIDSELEQIAVKNNFDILIRGESNQSIYTSNKDFYSGISEMLKMTSRNFRENDVILEKENKYIIREISDIGTNIKYIMLTTTLDNGYKLYIRMPITSVEESVKISNKFLYIIAVFVVGLGGIVISIVSKRFSQPIEDLNDIAKNMANLNFEKKYTISNSNDEIDNLGISINMMSNKLQSTIQELKNTNIELEKDIEEKSKIDEMRKSFISDVSHAYCANLCYLHACAGG